MSARLFQTALLTAILALLTACQGMPGTQDAEIADPMRGAPPISRGLDASSLETLLIAELAGRRGHYERATQGYLDVAERYGSAALTERATLAARLSEQPALLETAARRWHERAPDAEAPLRMLASLAQQRGDWQKALEMRLTLVATGKPGELASFAEQALGQGVEPQPLLLPLRRHLLNADDDAPHAHDAILATALLEAANGERGRAEARLDALSRTHPELPALWLTRARIALEEDDPTGARRAARRGLEVSPADSRFLLLLARSELALGRATAAERQTDRLLEQHDKQPELRLALARLFLEARQPAPARRLLLPLVDDDATPPAAFLLLGSIAEQQGEIDNALLYYRQVTEGEQFLGARLQAARMLIEADRLPDALEFLRLERLRHEAQAADLAALEVELLDEVGERDAADAVLAEARGRLPDNDGLLYMQAMRKFNAGDLAGMETDLRALIERRPDNAMAMNALGYTLADLTSRLEEARELIEEAHRLAPDNPAILDSLGWVLHKQGENDRALPYLEQAYARMPDQEIAAHLAEVLWALERTAEARDLIARGLARFEEHPKLDELIQRIPALAP
ncbi:tetratricopeptide repeat protein [Halomonas sp. YLGW01]|uniref:tetratricopeptide repeat protein n=1 Tax=Halomonas sp. YLGW01 TaxID=2773308 RepID=UPI00178494AD|nr:tetratricopeptide repeat protein [Halomonas sp. YLGW01]